MREIFEWIGVLIVALVIIGAVVSGGCYAVPKYNVWQKGLAGEAKLAEAEHSKQIKIQEAKAASESAKYLAEAEVIRARGVAEANAIIGESLKDNEAYLRYLWVQGLHDGTSETIYIATEANLPILEATRNLPPPVRVGGE